MKQVLQDLKSGEIVVCGKLGGLELEQFSVEKVASRPATLLERAAR